jgi:N-acyl-D-amino-acid deacylase
MGSVLIKNSTIIDGTGAPPEKKDLLIKDGRIVSLGHFSTQVADTVIDGLGLTTTPGFIDVNTDSDHYLSLFTDPAQQDFLLQGVTTIIGGHCGSSLAPLITGSLISIRKWGDINLVNVNWNTVGEFLRTLDTLPLGVNFGTLVGHSTVRRGILRDALRDLTVSELEMMHSVVREALRQGAFGVSTGLGYNHARNTPYPEIKMLAELAAEHNCVYTTHLRSEDEDILGSVAETIRIAEETKVRATISHFRAMEGFEESFGNALNLIEKSTAAIRFDTYPFDYSIVPLYTLLPAWAQQGSLEQMQQLINAPHHEAQLRESFASIDGTKVVIARAPGYDFLVGRTVAQYAEAQDLTVAEGLFTLLRQTKLRAVVFKKNVNFAATTKALLSERSFVASNSPSLLEGRAVLENERAVRTFSTFLSLAQQTGKRSLEWAVHKITEEPAAYLGLTGRGVLKEGAIADIAVLRGTQAVHVLVDGKVAVLGGVLQGVFAGKALRHR